MIAVLQLLIFGHIHKWKILYGPTRKEYTNSNFKVVKITNIYTLQCQSCGNLKYSES